MKTTKLIIASLAIGAIIAIIYTLLPANQKPKSTPPPISSPTPTPFKIQSTTPLEGKQPIILKNVALTFIFTKDIDPTSVKASITPLTNFLIEVNQENPKILHLRPQQNWELNRQYTITLSVNSTEGDSINDYQFNFEPLLPQVDEDIDYGNYGI